MKEDVKATLKSVLEKVEKEPPDWEGAKADLRALYDSYQTEPVEVEPVPEPEPTEDPA